MSDVRRRHFLLPGPPFTSRVYAATDVHRERAALKIRDLHRWDLSYGEAVRLQERLAPGVRETELRREPRTVCGLDVSHERRSDVVHAAAVVLSVPGLDVIEEALVTARTRFPYVPGLLSFREAPAAIEALRRLGGPPDLIVCDGQGRAHPRRLGLASHVGLWAGVPTVGVAKSRLVGEHREPAARRGSSVRLVDPGTLEVIGRVVRTRTGVKPVYVSVGHLVTLGDAVRWALRLSPRFRLPEPSRAAHSAANRMRTAAKGG